MGAEATKFMDWYQKELENGLVDVKFFTGDLSKATSESFFGEANEMHKAEFVSQKGYADKIERRDYSDMLK